MLLYTAGVFFIFISTKFKCVCAQLCPTLRELMDCSPPGSSVPGIFLSRILEWVAISSSRESSQPRDGTCISALAGGSFNTELPGKPTMEYYSSLKRRDILTCATTWMNLEDTMLSEISQSQKNQYCKAVKFIETESEGYLAGSVC